MPRFMSPMIRRRPVTDKLDEESRAVGPNAILPTNQESAQPSIEQNDEPEQPSDIRVSEGSFKQIRDESLVLLSQGISHRIDRSEDGPFQIFVEPEKRRTAQFQIRLYHLENPPRNDNPPLPLKFSLQPLWVLAVPVVCTLLDFSDAVSQTSFISRASHVLIFPTKSMTTKMRIAPQTTMRNIFKKFQIRYRENFIRTTPRFCQRYYRRYGQSP